jgi:hypothetical protein
MVIKNRTLISISEEDVEINSFTIPKNVETIKSKAFQNCDFLKTIEIPDTVLNIETRAFYNCKSLSTLIIDQKFLFVKYINHQCNIIKSTKHFDINTLYKVEVFLNKKNGILNLLPRYLAVIDDYGVYEETARQAYFNLSNKIFYTPLEERLSKMSFEKNKRYKAKEFYKTFFILTNICELGMREFIETNDIDLEKEMTLDEFINLCKNVPRGEVIKKLKTNK